METNGRFDGITRPYTGGRRRAPARDRPRRAHPRAPRRRAAVAAALGETATSAPSARSRAARPCRWSRPGSKRSTSPAGRWRPTRTSPGQTYPDQSLYPVNSVPALVRRINNALLRADQIDVGRGETVDLLAGADRRRRRGRVRRPAERLRADEGDDRGRRGGRALRGSARVREEVRPPRRQGARADRRSSSGRSIAARLAADVLRRADGARRADGLPCPRRC